MHGMYSMEKDRRFREVELSRLFEPVRVGNLKLENRLAMAPMTRNYSPKGVPGPNVAAYYRRRAEHGVGLIITEGTLVDHPAATAYERVPRMYGEASLAGWTAVVNGVHEAGSRVMPQLWHVGMVRKPDSRIDTDASPVGPSGLDLSGAPVAEPMTDRDIADIIEAFGRAAAEARRIGFDGVEIHGAHGYLIDQFFWSATNRRTDRYGGDLTARTRFAAEIVQACRKATSSDFPIHLRFSQWKIGMYKAKLATTPEELARFLEPLADAGVDAFHCSTRRFDDPEFPGSSLNLAGWTKKLTGKPTITVGAITADEPQLAKLAARLDNGEFDVAAVGRALFADAAWAAKVRDGRLDEVVPYSASTPNRLV